MCGRYWIEEEPEGEMAEIIAQMQRLNLERPVRSSGEVFPGDLVPVVCFSRGGRARPFAMEWGYTLPDGKKIINARSETAAEKPLFRESARLRRCLLPMSAYFEWEKRDGAKIKYRIAPVESGLHFLAGLYRFEGETPVCTVLTAPAAAEIAFIHDRMPVILPRAAREAWLEGGALVPEAVRLAANPV